MDKGRKLSIIKWSLFLWILISLVMLLFILQDILTVPFCLDCVSDPISAMATDTQKALGGVVVKTDHICLMKGEALDSASIINRSGIKSLEFICDSDICRGTEPALEVTPDRITPNGEVRIETVISCDLVTNSGRTCTAHIQSEYSTCYVKPIDWKTIIIFVLFAGFTVLISLYLLVRKS